MGKKYHVARETKIVDVLEVEATSIDDAINLIRIMEARLVNSTESEPVIINCWEKPTGIS